MPFDMTAPTEEFMWHNRGLRTISATLLLILVLVLAPNASAQSNYKTLVKFTNNGDGGSEPFAGLIFDHVGNLYGTTVSGGANKAGTVFKLTHNPDGSWTESVLYSFCSVSNTCADGEWPIAALTFDQGGNLYGTTSGGGANGAGTVFKLVPRTEGSWTESVLFSFCSISSCGDGWWPAAALIFDQAGNLYGTTEYGGNSLCQQGCGVAFKLAPNSKEGWSESVLYSFCSEANCADGEQPAANLIFDATGNLYGTAVSGGKSGNGVAFKLMPNSGGSWTESVLHSFCSLKDCSDGSNPLAGLIFDAAGNLYGTTFDNSMVAGPGVVFQLTLNGHGSWKEKVIHQFAGTHDGLYPEAGPTLDAGGNLYGTTYVGGDPNCYAIGCGVVFKLAPNSKGGWRETVLHSFYDHPGAFPSAGVTLDGAGNLYGTTQGHNTTFGSVFEIAP
jgi:uncharacterized repeat protein (TIGR03803 family)